MKLSRVLGMTAAAVVLAGTLAPVAWASEPRPWLCRDKPVFSSDRPLAYQASARAGRQWQLFFMEFDPNGPHDGFSIMSARDLGLRGAELSGKLPGGRYYAVPLYKKGGYWICPGYTRDDSLGKTGVVADLCYGTSEPACLVKLIVKPDQALAAPSSLAP
jgi:hypothetical protein